MELTRRTKWLIGILVAAPCVLAVAWFVWSHSASLRLRRRLAAIREGGDPVCLADLTAEYAPVPRERDAAPLLQEAFGKLVELGDAARADLPYLGEGELPPVGEPVPEATLAAMERCLAVNAEALRLVHQAVEREECRYPVAINPNLGLTLSVPYAPLRQVNSLLAIEAVCHTERRRPAQAAASLLDSLRLARTLRSLPDLMSALVRMGLSYTALSGIERWLARVTPSPERLRALEAALREEGEPGVLRGIVAAERCLIIDAYFRCYIRATAPAAAPAPPLLSPTLDRWLPRAYFKDELAVWLDLLDELVEAAGRPYPESVIEGARLAERLEDRIPGQYIIARQFAGTWGIPFRAVRDYTARLDSARVALAALRYRARHGELPRRLDDLVDEFLPAVPTDPFTRQPLRYLQSEEGILVYAQGTNGQDDGGQLEFIKGERPDVGFCAPCPAIEP